jgi:hypothetical protein
MRALAYWQWTLRCRCHEGFPLRGISGTGWRPARRPSPGYGLRANLVPRLCLEISVSPQPPDFNRLFAEGSTHNFSHFRDGCVATVRVVAGADLRLPTGRLVAAEPWAYFHDGAGRYAFVQRVEPGAYPVQLIIADYYDPGNPQGNTRFDEVAAARLVIRDEPAGSWRLALRDGQDDTQLAGDEYYGYPVDGGTGSFGSPEVFDALASGGDPDQLVYLVGGLEENDEVGVHTDEATGSNLVCFRSGGGDGRYGTWVGYTDQGEVACFVTDFMTLTHGENDNSPHDPEPAAPLPAPCQRRGPASYARGAEMLAGQTLRRQSLTSPSGEFVLVHQDDGNLVLYRYGQDGAVWATGTYNTPAGECVLQEDGNLVVYNREGHAVWASGTHGRPVTRLAVRDNGTVTLENAAGETLWSTGPLPGRGTH